MLGMLKRHEVEILLKAGHSKMEVARLAGVSRRSVHRLAGEAPVVDVDDAAERVRRRIGRPSLVENFRKLVVEILEEQADLPSVEILRGASLKAEGLRRYHTVLTWLELAPAAN